MPFRCGVRGVRSVKQPLLGVLLRANVVLKALYHGIYVSMTLKISINKPCANPQHHQVTSARCEATDLA